MLCFCSYFASRFPNLLMTCYCFGLRHCADEPMLAKYYPQGARDFPMPMEMMSARFAASQRPTSTAQAVEAIKVPPFSISPLLEPNAYH